VVVQAVMMPAAFSTGNSVAVAVKLAAMKAGM
jgi:hypothetical protein